jgi:hypothetical protein
LGFSCGTSSSACGASFLLLWDLDEGIE